MYGLGEGGVVSGAGIPAGGIQTFEDWNAFAKAIQTSTYETDHSQLTGVGGLRVESLEATLKKIIEKEESFKLFRALKRQPVTSSVHEYTAQTSIGGQPGGAFNSETGPISSEVGEYDRRITFVKYLMTQAQISHVASVQKTIVPLKARENANALLRLSRAANWSMYQGNAAVAPMQFDGIEAILSDFRGGSNIRDLEGSSDVGAIVDTIFESFATAMGEGNFGKITHVHMDPITQAALDRYLDPAFRVNLDNNPAGLQLGAPVKAIRTSFGDVATEQDIWIEGPENAKPAYAKYGKVPDDAPGTPTVSAAANASAGSKFDSDKAGTYYYVVAAIDERGVEGIPSTAVSAAVAADGSVTLTITPNSDRKQTGYAIYRSTQDPATAPALADYRLVKRIPANPDRTATTVFEDKNEDIPGSSKLFLLNRVPEAIEWIQLLPATQFPLYPTNAAIIPWAVLLYGALQLSIPNHHFVIKNFLPPLAKWKPFK